MGLNIIIIQILVLCIYMTMSLLTQLHEDDPSLSRSKDAPRYVNYKQCDILMLHMGSPDNINHLQACSIESVATHHPYSHVCLAIYVS